MSVASVPGSRSVIRHGHVYNTIVRTRTVRRRRRACAYHPVHVRGTDGPYSRLFEKRLDALGLEFGALLPPVTKSSDVSSPFELALRHTGPVQERVLRAGRRARVVGKNTC